MMVAILLFTMVGSWISSRIPNTTISGFSVFMTLLLGIRFLLKPVMTTKADMLILDQQTRLRRSIGCGILIGLVCSFIEAGGGGMMMLLVLTSALGYELKTAVGTICLDGSTKPFCHWRSTRYLDLVLRVASTLLWARIAARIANRATGIILMVIGAAILIVNLLS